jgi:hypothetical protein
VRCTLRQRLGPGRVDNEERGEGKGGVSRRETCGPGLALIWRTMSIAVRPMGTICSRFVEPCRPARALPVGRGLLGGQSAGARAAGRGVCHCCRVKRVLGPVNRTVNIVAAHYARQHWRSAYSPCRLLHKRPLGPFNRTRAAGRTVWWRLRTGRPPRVPSLRARIDHDSPTLVCGRAEGWSGGL